MILQNSVTKTPRTADDRANIVNSLWKNKVQIPPAKLDWEAFFVYYTDECNSALFYDGHATIETHQDLVDIAQKLQNGCEQNEITRDIVQLYKRTTRKATAEDQIKRMAEGSLKLAVRLVAMVDVGSISPNCVQGYTSLGWSDPHHNLQTLLRDHFKESTSVLGFSKFGRFFNAHNLQRYAGLKIRWTDNLNNHLRLVDEDTTLCVFHHITFLKGQNRSERHKVRASHRLTLLVQSFLKDSSKKHSTLLNCSFRRTTSLHPSGLSVNSRPRKRPYSSTQAF
jgi:hypothetical protein